MNDGKRGWELTNIRVVVLSSSVPAWRCKAPAYTVALLVLPVCTARGRSALQALLLQPYRFSRGADGRIREQVFRQWAAVPA